MKRSSTADLLRDIPDLDVIGADVQIRRPKSFSEKAFVRYVTKLCRAGRHDDAESYFLENAEALLGSGSNQKEKLNHLIFLPRLIQSGGGTKYGYRKLIRKAGGVEGALAKVAVPPGGTFIELGCGAHDPLALATYFYVNGFKPAFGIDLLAPRSEQYSAASMYDIIANMRAFPERYCRPGGDPSEVLRRSMDFDLAAFESGDFWAGFARIADQVAFKECDIVEAGIEKSSVSFLISFAVLEHVSDIEGVCGTIFDILKPGGIAFHFVDLSDHRAYRGGASLGPFHFLTEEEGPSNLNRLRAPEITAAHNKAGFEILKDTRWKAPMSEEVRRRLLPHFREMRPDDVRVIKQQLLVRRPLKT